jgi:4-hydroxy-2-oxoheptanedioate aldolase
MRTNRLRQIWDEGRAFTIAWLGVPNTFTAEVMARQGFDALCVDMQHGLIDYSDAWRMFQAISQTETVPITRVPWNDPAILMKVLDAGAYGVVVPLINSAEEAAAAVAACRFPPAGIRSFGPIRASLYGGADYAAHADDEILVFGMIETKAGLENLDAICATPGLDGVYIGPADLSYALGLSPRADNTDPLHLETCDRILATAHRHGKRAGMHTASGAFSASAIQRGFDFVTVTSDVACLAAGAKHQLEGLRAGLAGGDAPATGGAASPY